MIDNAPAVCARKNGVDFSVEDTNGLEDACRRTNVDVYPPLSHKKIELDNTK